MRFRYVSILVLLAALLFAMPRPALAVGAREYVQNLLDRVISVLEGKGPAPAIDRKGKRKAIQRIMREGFDLPVMARKALTIPWNSIPQEKRKAYTRLFGVLFQESYTRLVLDFLKREELEMVGERKADGYTVVVTRIRRRNDAIPVEYYLHRTRGGWKIVDVDIDGVRIGENYREAFSRTIRLHSFDGLLERMRIQEKALKG